MPRNSGIIVYQAQLATDPSTPTSGYGVIYPKTDGKWYAKDPSGVVIEITKVSITRSINSITTTTSAGSTPLTDYIYLCTGTFTVTMPTAVGNTNSYMFKVKGTGIVTIATILSQTIDEGATAILAKNNSAIELISNGSNWNIF